MCESGAGRARLAVPTNMLFTHVIAVGITSQGRGKISAPDEDGEIGLHGPSIPRLPSFPLTSSLQIVVVPKGATRGCAQSVVVTQTLSKVTLWVPAGALGSLRNP